jgi:hypothetical protein
MPKGKRTMIDRIAWGSKMIVEWELLIIIGIGLFLAVLCMEHTGKM